MHHTHRRQIIGNSLRYMTATMFGQVVGLIRGILIPVLLSPAQLGIWNLMNVVVGYGGNAHLGVLHGMNKLIPMLRGQSASAEVEQIKDGAFWINTLLSVGWFAAIWMTSYFVSAEYSTPLRITATIVFLLNVFAYYYSLLRADNRFKLVSVGVGGLSVLCTFFVVGFSWFSRNRLIGALIGLAVAYGLVVLFWSLASRYRFAFRLDGKAVSRSFVVGIPLIILGIFDSFFLSIDRWVIASYLGATMLGYYALGIMASSLIGLVPGSIAGVLYPKMLERFGASSDPVKLKGLFAGPTRFMATSMSLLIGGSVLILPVLVRFLLPKYLPSVPLLCILLPASFFYAATGISGCMMIAINKQKVLFAIQIVAIILAVVLDLLAVKMEWMTIGVAWSTAVVYAVYGSGYTCFAAYFAFEQRADMMRFLVDVYAIFTAMVLGLLLAIFLIPEGVNMGTAIAFTMLRLICFLAVMFPALWWLNRNGELFSIAREIFSTYFRKPQREQEEGMAS